MIITIEDISNSIKEIFKDAEILSTDTIYEKIDDSENLKLIVFFNKMVDKTLVIYTKFIFIVNKEKTQLVNNSFSYLYDVNCVYHKKNFEDIEDFKKNAKNIFDNKEFGINTKVLSQFVENPAFLINDWFEKNDVTNLSVFSVTYSPKIHVMPCKSLFFSFNININNTNDVELIIRKENSNQFNFSFRIFDKTISINKNDLNTLVETVGDTLKNNL